MRRILLAAGLATLIAPSSALAAGSVAGATQAVVRAVAEEGGNAIYYGIPQVHCRHTAPSKFGCSFFNLNRHLGGRVTVTFTRGHYYVGEPRYEPLHNLGPAPHN